MYEETKVTLDGRVYREVIFFDPSEDYSWEACGLYQREDDAAYFYHFECGCSCYHYGEDLQTEADLEPVTSPHASVELVKRDFGDVRAVDYARRLLFGGAK